jgi:hypothetical protein
LILEVLWFKLDSQNFDFIKILAQIINNLKTFDKTKKYFNLCQNGKGTVIVNNLVSQNNKVQIDYPIILASSNRLVQINKVVFFMPIILNIFLLKKSIKKP